MERAAIAEKILRPPTAPRTRILFLARHAPLAPDYACAAYPGDGGYPAYYRRVWSVLVDLGYKVTTANQCRALYRHSNDIDLVFSLYNRAPIDNPEIFVAATCEFLHLPHVGAKPNIRALAEDKWIAKNFVRSLGLPVAEGAVYSCAEDLSKAPSFAGPYFVKNRFGAASEGISEQSIQDDWTGASRVAESFFARGMEVLVEAYAPGVDVTLPVLGGEEPFILGLVRPRSDRLGAIITEDLKRDDPLGYELFDAGARASDFGADARALWAGAGPMDYLRLDYRFDPATGRRVFLEFNICCHIGRSGAICLAGAQWGLSQADILGHVVEFSLRRQAREKETRRWAL
jgi:D-alanine-D-alanine ligase